MNPAHTLGSRLRTRDRQRLAGRIDADHVEAAFGQEQRERPGATTDVQDAPGPELVGDGEVHIEIAAVRIERVVHRRQPRVLEDRVSHSPLPSTKTATRVEAQYAVL